MHAQVTRARFQPGRLDDVAAIFRDSVVPAARQQPGYQSARLFIDREADRAIVVSLWATRADVGALATSGVYLEQIGKVAPFFAAPPEREVYELAVDL